MDGGHRAIVFNRLTGVKESVLSEGMHFVVPWFEWPYIYDVRTKPRNVQVRNVPTSSGCTKLTVWDIYMHGRIFCAIIMIVVRRQWRHFFFFLLGPEQIRSPKKADASIFLITRTKMRHLCVVLCVDPMCLMEADYDQSGHTVDAEDSSFLWQWHVLCSDVNFFAAR